MAVTSAIFFLLAASSMGDVIEKTYVFPEPEARRISLPTARSGSSPTFDRIVMGGLPSNGTAGAPAIPLKPVTLLLPQGQGVLRIEVASDEYRRLEGSYFIAPSQRARPLSLKQDYEPTPPDPVVYGSKKVFPGKVRSSPKTHWCRGYGILSFNLYPVRYAPAEGAVFYTRRMTVRIHTVSRKAPEGVVRHRGLLGDRIWLEGLVNNPGMVKTYRASNAPPGPMMKLHPDGPGQKPFKGSHHPYVIITNEDLAADPGPHNFQALLDLRKARGLPGLLKTVEEIYEEFEGQDDQEKIRNFCRFAYENWNTEYVLLGGDGNDGGLGRIVPARGMWATAEGYTTLNLKADLYYANLDGSFNFDNDKRWGEIGDGPGGGEVDLYSELFVGRAPVMDGEELHNFVRKTIAYETDDYTEPWYTRAHFVGEFLWTNTWGGTYMDEVKDGCGLWGYSTAGFPDSWNKTTLYEKNGSWWPSTLISTLNSNNLHLLNHLGHASTGYVMKLIITDVKALTNTRYFFAYSQGCDAGSIASGHSIAEQFTVSDHGAFAVVMNDKYGWGEVGCTDGSSQYLHRQFVDAIFGEGIKEAGRVNADSKEDNVWCIDYKANRWCAYETNLIGDPAVPLAGPLLSSKGLLHLDRSAYKDGGLVEITLEDLDLNMNPKIREEITLPVDSAGGDSESVLLRETGIDSAWFIGSIQVKQGGSAAPGSGQLELNHGETFEVTYTDEDDGFGHTQVKVTAQAEADFVPPALSNVHVAFVDDSRVEVAWTADEPVTGMLVYGETAPPETCAYSHQLLIDVAVQAEDLVQCTDYVCYVLSADAAGNETADDNSGNLYPFSTRQRFYPLMDEMNEDPGWTISPSCKWEWGQPEGKFGDPDSGFTGPFVYGYNLAGPYDDSMTEKHLLTPPIDCTGLEDVSLEFWRMLPILGGPGDNASLSVSKDGNTWTEIYHNPVSPYIEPTWLHWTYDISAVADGQPNVYVRWTMGPTNDGGGKGGWNIDDVIVSGVGTPGSPWLVHESHSIDDGAGGNGNGLIEPKETITMPLTLCNTGLDAQSVQVTLKAYSPHVVLLDDQAAFPDMKHGGKGTSNAPHFIFDLGQDAEDGDELIFGADWTSGGDSGFFTFVDHVRSPRLALDDFKMIEVGGDGDGCLDPGETVTVTADLKNLGSIGAANVSATLESSHPQYITILDDHADFGYIPVGEVRASQPPHFMLAADVNALNYTWVEFTLTVTGDNYHGKDHFFLEITDCNLQIFWPLDSDPGWAGTKKWAFGVPTGNKPAEIGGGCPDPTEGYTGDHVLGYNLYGAYDMYMKEETLTSSPIDCSALEAVKVRFKRWLGVASAQYDHATFQVSKDNVNWVTVWDHTENKNISDNAWVSVEYDISAVADHEPTVYLRWIMGPTGFVLVFCGWNIDDIEIWGR